MIKLLVLCLLVALDLITKKIIFNMINLNSFLVVNFFLDIAHIHNYGISFGFLSGIFPAWVLIIIGLLVTLLVYLMFLQSKTNLEKWGFIFIIAGALSNILDRTINGFVIDFIYLHFKEFYWPAFNFADIYITMGFLIIMLQFLTDLNKRFFK